MRENIILLASIFALTTCNHFVFGQTTTNDVWINEFHYDNDGSDENEFVEIVIKDAGSYDVSLFTLSLYNGNGGTIYASYSGNEPEVTVGETIGNFTFVRINVEGIQNGEPDGLALSYNDELIQFLSYEGTFTATEGPANGQTSMDVGVSETGGATAPVGYSLQLTGHGYGYDDLTWTGPVEDSPGDINFGQYLYPTLEFGSDNATVAENVGTVNIPVKITNPDGNAVSVDVEFHQNPSVAEAEDFLGAVTQTVVFGTGATDGEIQNATFSLNDDSDYEGLESARFVLTNISSTGPAEIIGRSEFTLNITDDETPNVVINEFLADPGTTNGDADNSGIVSSDDDEFVEIVNGESVEVNLSNWTVSDEAGIKFTFDANTILPANGTIVVFGGEDFTGTFGNALVFGTGSLGLNNSSDTITLRDELNNIIDQHTYGSEGVDDQSLVRDPEITGSFVKHSVATGSSGSLFSPGTKTDGTLFTNAMVIDGTAGWRMLSAPATDIPIQALTNFFPVQGYQGFDESFEKNLFTGYDGTAFTPASSDLSGNLNSGEGFILYVYNNNENGSSTLPVSMDVSSFTEPVSDVSVSVHANGDRWNLLGNPYQTAFDVTSITQTGGTLAGLVGHVWSDADESYILTSANDDKVAAGQGFFIQNDESTPATSVTLPVSGKTSGTRFYKTNESKGFIQLALMSEDIPNGMVQKDLSTVLYFHEKAETGRDAYDSDKLYPLKPAFSLLGFINPDSEMLKAQDSRPYFSEGEEIFELDVMSYNVKPEQTIKWVRSKHIPEQWVFIFVDNLTGEEIEMDPDFEYAFSLEGERQSKVKVLNQLAIEHPLSVSTMNEVPRFTIRLNKGTATSTKPLSSLPDRFVLEQNYPNPFNPTTSIRYKVASQAKVSLEVYNLMGQKVATLIDQVQSPGAYRAFWNASTQSSGVYYYRLKAGNTVLSRKMTLIK